MFLHLLQVQKLRTLLHLIGQLLLKIIPQGFQLGLVPRLHILSQFVPLLIILMNLLVPNLVEGSHLILVRAVQIVPLLVVPHLHLVDSSCLQIFLELLGGNPQILRLHIIPILLVIMHLTQCLVQERL